jgi:hypothetical protein
VTGVSSLSLGFVHSLDSGSRVHSHRPSEDEAVLGKFSDVFSYN